MPPPTAWRITNRSATENLVLLKHFGPGNPQAPASAAMRRSRSQETAARLLHLVLAARGWPVGVRRQRRRGDRPRRRVAVRGAQARRVLSRGRGDGRHAHGRRHVRRSQARARSDLDGVPSRAASRPTPASRSRRPAVLTGKTAAWPTPSSTFSRAWRARSSSPSKKPVVLDQHGCMFVPRVIGIRAGQTLDLKNGDTVSHNVHPMPTNNREWNQEQSPQRSRRGTPLRAARNHDPGEVQHPRLDARLDRRGGSSLLRRYRPRWHVRVEERAAGRLHDFGLAREARQAEAAGAPCRQRYGRSKLHLSLRFPK